MTRKRNHDEFAHFARESPFTSKLSKMRSQQGQPQPSVNYTALEQIRQSSEQFENVSTGVAGDDIEKLALTDKLTGLHNSRAFLRKLRYELKRGMRYKRPLAVVLISVDGMDNLKRQYGDAIGDSILQSVAGTVAGVIRDVDVAARYSASELAVIFPETNANGVMVVADRIRQRIRNQPFAHQYQSIYLSVSVGAAAFPAHAREADELLARASQALDLAVHRGGDRVCSI